ncbi:hypothetical protein D3C87_1304550 [compost metagenome]
MLFLRLVKVEFRYFHLVTIQIPLYSLINYLIFYNNLLNLVRYYHYQDFYKSPMKIVVLLVEQYLNQTASTSQLVIVWCYLLVNECIERFYHNLLSQRNHQ